jgi:hypothetical protein
MRTLATIVATLLFCGCFDFDGYRMAGAGSGGGAAGSGGTAGQGGTGGTGGACNPATLTTDPRNCGVCGHDCQGGACEAGQCLPLVLAPNRQYPYGIAVGPNDVYWLDNGLMGAGSSSTPGRVMRVPKFGGDAVELAGGRTSPTHLALRDSDVFWTESAVWTLRSGSGAAQISSSSWVAKTATAAAIDAQGVYWLAFARTQALSSTTLRVIRTGFEGGDQVVSSSSAPHDYTTSLCNGVAVDDTYVYWADDEENMIYKAPKTGGPAMPLTSTNLSPVNLAVSATHVYWTDYNQTLERVAKSGGFAELVVGNQATPRGLVVDGDTLYWVDFSLGSVLRAPAQADTTVAVLAAGQAGPHRIAIDTTSIYWTNSGTPEALYSDGAVMKLAK